MGVAFFESDDVKGHVDIIRRQLDRSLQDRQTIQLAQQIARGHYDQLIQDDYGETIPVIYAWGQPYQLTYGRPQKAQAPIDEVMAVWNFYVCNVEYRLDPDGIGDTEEVPVDMFSTVELTLESGTGDCFPEGTLVLREDGAMVPIEAICEGECIHDGTSFVEVTKTWKPKRKPMVRLGLNNGDTIRLSEDHHVWRVPRTSKGTSGRYAEAERVRVCDVRLGDDLLQPREFGGGSVELDPDDAFLLAMYVTEGWGGYDGKVDESKRPGRIGFAGVRDGKGLREELERIFEERGIHFQGAERQVTVRSKSLPHIDCRELGRTALHKRLPHMNWGPKTAAILLDVMERADGGWSTSGKTMVYSSVSYELALQYRVLARMHGYSASMTCLTNHGGAGRNPIYRVTRRADHQSRPWARVKSLLLEPEPTRCYDITTETSKVYLPESDTIVSQCDDQVVTMGALLKALGFQVKARVVSTNKEFWEHVYLAVGLPKGRYPSHWIPLDATVQGAIPGWEYTDSTNVEDVLL